MPISESTLSRWSHHQAGTAFKEAHAPIREALTAYNAATIRAGALRLANIYAHNHDHLSSHPAREWSFECGSRRVTRRIAVIRVDRGVLRHGLRNATL